MFAWYYAIFFRDVMDLVVNPPDNIYSIPSEKNIFCVQSMIIGSVDTPYEGGFFHFYIRFVDKTSYLNASSG